MKHIHNEQRTAIAVTLKKTQTPIERIYPQLWSSENAPHTGHPVITREQLVVLPFYKEPYENALRRSVRGRPVVGDL